MLKSEVIKFYSEKTYWGGHSGQANAAKALGISRAAVNKWGRIIPKKRAIDFHRITGGKLKFEEKYYFVEVIIKKKMRVY